MSQGDHIIVRKAGYAHHGIRVDGDRVVHFVGTPVTRKRASVVKTSLDEFATGRKLYRVKYTSCLPPEEVVALAQTKIGEPGCGLIFHNCEHFAVWCKTGRSEGGILGAMIRKVISDIAILGIPVLGLALSSRRMEKDVNFFAAPNAASGLEKLEE